MELLYRAACVAASVGYLAALVIVLSAVAVALVSEVLYCVRRDRDVARQREVLDAWAAARQGK